MPTNQELALKELAKLGDPKQALLALQALEKRRREEQFIKYWVPTQKQIDALKQFDETIKVFGLRGGNRSGKTETGAAIVTAAALGKDFFKGEPAWEWVQYLPFKQPPLNIWVVGLDFPTLRDVIWREKLRYGRNHPGMLPALGVPNGVRKVNDSDFQVFLDNGTIITGKSADSGREKFQGASVDIVWIDEECESAVFDECYQRTVDCAGKILLTLTPLTDIASGVREPWVYDLYEESCKGVAKDVRFVSLSVLDNPYVPQEEKEKLLTKWAGHPEERARLYGDFVQRSGLVYHMFSPKVHLTKRFRIPNDWPCVVSIDPAATGVTAALWGRVDPSGNLYLVDEYYEKNKVVSDHAKDILIRNRGQKVDYWLIDPTWGRQRNNETHKTGAQLYRDSGIQVRLAEVENDFGLNISLEYMNASLDNTSRHPKVFIFDDLHNFIHEITHYTWATFGKGENQGLSKEKPTKRNDHLMNAYQYLCAMRPKGNRRTEANLSKEDLERQAKLNSYT